MSLIAPDDPRPVHFVGIAGAGMSALAELLCRRGVTVTGCDALTDSVDDLARLGIQITRGHDPSHVTGARALVVTSAMPKDHPELLRARELGLPVIRRAEALGEATTGQGRDLVAVAGTHGKSTTTVMAAEALAGAGGDPTALVGGRVAEWGGNLRPGRDSLYVVEADEYDRSFLALTPTVAVVTNIEADHLDIYQDLDDIRGTFAAFAREARFVVLCADDPGANAMETSPSSEVIRYGIDSRDARLLARELTLGALATRFEVEYDGERLGEVELRVPGLHNVRNALGAIGAGLALGGKVPQLAQGLARFGGVERRFQRLGEVHGVAVIDDYAHHPTEIEATLGAARSAFPGRRLVAAFQPHLYSRTRDFATEFGRALAPADILLLTEIYAAREQPMPGVTTTLLTDAVTQAGGTVHWRGDRSHLADAIASVARDGDVVVLMGAGDITRTGPELLARIAPAARAG
jgi:UDP-N-acetylmuramate--alanine ligase